ncbi:alpha/beta hydrolase [Amycolatopsis thermalba]|uniref:Alpha/beta hydrolase n=1 Tax=Amycolatopsis thermalba TaxID=944492 RepID=A0ABY4NTU8_9PSEU|nr:MULTISPECIES: alpha/beta hydrolase [Amycolatopsis]UQS23494.1 alpha/beta hydrolase [Amycolatopsis thermalba]
MTTSTPYGPPPAFDPEAAAMLAVIAEEVPPTVTADMIPALRAARSARLPSDAELSRDGRLELVDRRVSDEVSVLVARPADLGTTAPGIFWIHGGGMVVGTNRVGIEEPLDWALELGLVVVSVEYRLAPEHPHPVPVEDCYAGLRWTSEHAGELGIDPARLIVAGGSAGGGLGAAVALMARDRGGPRLAGQLLIAPMLDDRNETPSTHQMKGLGVWDRTSNETGWTALLGEARGGPDVSPYAAPARATDLSGLPPAFIDVGSAESFRDEDVDYARRIWLAGGSAELHVWPGGYHGFDAFAPRAALSQEARATRLRWLRRMLAE